MLQVSDESCCTVPPFLGKGYVQYKLVPRDLADMLIRKRLVDKINGSVGHEHYPIADPAPVNLTCYFISAQGRQVLS
jgi:hypothetical protein